MGSRTDPQPFLLSARATQVRAMAQSTRARSANAEDRVGQAMEDPAQGQADRQTEMFLELIQELRRDRQDRQRPQLPIQPDPQPNAGVFKPPEYNGVGSIEVFIRQFLDVAEANNWGERTTVLHLRRALKDEARDCGGVFETMGEIFTALRARFGISPREARVRLNGARREANVPLQVHANKVKELVGIAYPAIPRDVQEQMTLDQFVNTLNQPRLQEHLLAIRPDTLTEAITAGNEFLQVRSNQTRIKQLEVEDEKTETEAQVMPLRTSPPAMAPAPLPANGGPGLPAQPAFMQPVPGPATSMPGQPSAAAPPAQPRMVGPTQPAIRQPGPVQPNPMGGQLFSAPPVGMTPPWTGTMDPMAALMAAMTQMTQGLAAIQQNLGNRGERRPPRCWQCGKEGHLQNRCGNPPKNQGNKGGQQ